MSSLLVTAGLHQGRRFPLRERMRVGRAADNEIVLADHLVSRYHAEISRQGVDYHVRDLGSKNGMQVNDVPASERRLNPGDRIQIGKTLFIFEPNREIKAARFSDKLVQLDRVTDEAMIARDSASLPPPPATDTTRLVRRLEALLNPESDSLSDHLHSLLLQIMEMFGATGGSILLRSASGEPTPLVAATTEENLPLSRSAIQAVFEGGKSVLTARIASNEPSRQIAQRVMVVPLLHRSGVIGAIHLERPAGPEYSLEDLAELNSFSRLISGVVRCAMQMDQFILEVPQHASEPFVGLSSAAEATREQVRRIAASNSTVLLTGETGTGKELVAHAIHESSNRAGGNFVTIDCSAIPGNLMESELFGHEAGAFTGADRLKRGKVELADGGTLFLDEIGELQIDLQPKLLRFMEDLHFYRVGGIRLLQSDVRIIAATNRDLLQAGQENRFRQDLLYRLNVMPIHLPPLRERPEDIRPLVDHFIPRLAVRLGKPFLGLVDETWTLLERYPWPGNVRELRHALERALILSDDGILRPEHFQLVIPEPPLEPTTDGARSATVDQTQTHVPKPLSSPSTLAQAEADAIRRALRHAGGNRMRAAEILDIHRNTLAKKIAEYGISI